MHRHLFVQYQLWNCLGHDIIIIHSVCEARDECPVPHLHRSATPSCVLLLETLVIKKFAFVLEFLKTRLFCCPPNNPVVFVAA